MATPLLRQSACYLRQQGWPEKLAWRSLFSCWSWQARFWFAIISTEWMVLFLGPCKLDRAWGMRLTISDSTYEFSCKNVWCNLPYVATTCTKLCPCNLLQSPPHREDVWQQALKFCLLKIAGHIRVGPESCLRSGLIWQNFSGGSMP